MELYMTSVVTDLDWTANSPVSGNVISKNDFVKNVGAHWTPDARVLYVAADEKDYAGNDASAADLKEKLNAAGLTVGTMEVLDYRIILKDSTLGLYDTIILGGGHVPTQNATLTEMNFAEKLSYFDGVILGISAGSMNCAKTVYAMPELPGEAEDPSYKRFIPGLGLSEIQIVPHWNILSEEDKNMALEDSKGKRFIAIPDGTYLHVTEEGNHTVYGEAYELKNGACKQICSDGKKKTLLNLFARKAVLAGVLGLILGVFAGLLYGVINTGITTGVAIAYGMIACLLIGLIASKFVPTSWVYRSGK